MYSLSLHAAMYEYFGAARYRLAAPDLARPMATMAIARTPIMQIICRSLKILVDWHQSSNIFQPFIL